MPRKSKIDHPPRAGSSASDFAALSGFGSTVMDAFAQTPVPPTKSQQSVFDVCHIGVVLRTVLFVHGVLGVGLTFTTRGVLDWMIGLATAASVALPGSLVWLLVACLIMSRWTPGNSAWQLIIGTLLGALAALAGWMLGQFSGLAVFESHVALAYALTGAGFAWVITGWLQLRARGHWPAETQARLMELQSRIRPHFLFNTLNTALSLVHLNPSRAESVLEDLAELFRVALTETGSAVKLGEEIELARRYLDIEQIRFGERMQVVWLLDPAAATAQVPPLLLQPLVENAVRHGIEPNPQGGVIRIRTSVKMGRVYIVISNSLPGHPSNPGHGIALANVRERLRLMHDVAAQFEARVHQNSYYVQIGVPL
jgi:two-component system, LytTR family, sensor histidine kinase AlgZ